MSIKGKVYPWMVQESRWIRQEECEGIELSQWGMDGRDWQNRPRLEGMPFPGPSNDPDSRRYERDISMIEGSVDAIQAFRSVRGKSPRGRDKERTRVRRFWVRDLWSGELGTYRSPSKRNPSHVSVVPDPRLGIPDDDLVQQGKFWDDRGSQNLERAAREVP